jgi:hypothetical protein
MRVILDGSEELTEHSSGLCLQKRTQPGTGVGTCLLTARELDLGREASAQDPDVPQVKIAMARAAG